LHLPRYLEWKLEIFRSSSQRKENDMAQQGHNNPGQPDKQAPNRQPGSQQDPSRRAEPHREPNRQPNPKNPERDMPKRASRPEEDEE
jgi:hypothetical protein